MNVEYWKICADIVCPEIPFAIVGAAGTVDNSQGSGSGSNPREKYVNGPDSPKINPTLTKSRVRPEILSDSLLDTLR